MNTDVIELTFDQDCERLEQLQSSRWPEVMATLRVHNPTLASFYEALEIAERMAMRVRPEPNVRRMEVPLDAIRSREEQRAPVDSGDNCAMCGNPVEASWYPFCGHDCYLKARVKRSGAADLIRRAAEPSAIVEQLGEGESVVLEARSRILQPISPELVEDSRPLGEMLRKEIDETLEKSWGIKNDRGLEVAEDGEALVNLDAQMPVIQGLQVASDAVDAMVQAVSDPEKEGGQALVEPAIKVGPDYCPICGCWDPFCKDNEGQSVCREHEDEWQARIAAIAKLESAFGPAVTFEKAPVPPRPDQLAPVENSDHPKKTLSQMIADGPVLNAEIEPRLLIQCVQSYSKDPEGTDGKHVARHLAIPVTGTGWIMRWVSYHGKCLAALNLIDKQEYLRLLLINRQELKPDGRKAK